MLSTEAQSNDRKLSLEEREALLDVAQSSIQFGLSKGRPLAVDPDNFPHALRKPRASFVTLRINTELRGCIGSVKVRRPVVVDVAHNAFHAAFQDPRFPPLRAAEFPMLTIHVSVLSPMQRLAITSEEDLLEQVRPGTDGLELECGRYRGLLLPSVWENLPEKKQFVRALKMKAGLPPTFWSQQLNVHRFTTESFSRNVVTLPERPAT